MLFPRILMPDEHIVVEGPKREEVKNEKMVQYGNYSGYGYVDFGWLRHWR